MTTTSRQIDEQIKLCYHTWMETNTHSRMVLWKDVNGTEEGKRDHFNEVMAAIMLSRALCRRDRGVGGFLAAWECIAMCF